MISPASAQDRHAMRRAQTGGVGTSSSRRAIPEYVSRLVDFKQMDFQSALSQMAHLLRSPSEVYKMSHYHKEIKNQWARDDPAFVVLLCAFLLGASLLYAIAFHCSSIAQYLVLVAHLVVFDFLLLGACIASTTRWIANTYLKPHSHASISAFAVEQEVEWGYAFDIHCNAFFTLFVALHAAQFLLYPLLSAPELLPTICANSLYALAFGYYCYITFLGYASLPFVRDAQCFLFPVLPIVIAWALACILRINVTAFTLSFYFA